RRVQKAVQHVCNWRRRRQTSSRAAVSDRRRGRSADARVEDDGLPVGAWRHASRGPGRPVLPGAGAGRARLPRGLLRRNGMTWFVLPRALKDVVPRALKDVVPRALKDVVPRALKDVVPRALEKL